MTKRFEIGTCELVSKPTFVMSCLAAMLRLAFASILCMLITFSCFFVFFEFSFSAVVPFVLFCNLNK